jgi:hypothetical protein
MLNALSAAAFRNGKNAIDYNGRLKTVFREESVNGLWNVQVKK